jgi:hypothetical protein
MKNASTGKSCRQCNCELRRAPERTNVISSVHKCPSSHPGGGRAARFVHPPARPQGTLNFTCAVVRPRFTGASALLRSPRRLRPQFIAAGLSLTRSRRPGPTHRRPVFSHVRAVASAPMRSQDAPVSVLCRQAHVDQVQVEGLTRRLAVLGGSTAIRLFVYLKRCYHVDVLLRV